jgi:O-antigen/teichoic acid export membrane protein
MSGAGLLLGIVLAHALGPTGLGNYASVMASAVIIGTLLSFGTEIPYNIRAAHDPDQGIGLLTLIGLQATFSLPIAGVIWLVLRSVDRTAAPSWLMVPAAAAFILNQLTLPVLSGLQRQITGNIIASVLLLLQALTIFLISRVQTQLLLPIAISCYIVSLIILYIVSVAALVKRGIHDFKLLTISKDLIREGKVYLLATACGVIRLRANVAILAWLTPASEAGNYQILQTCMEVLFLIPVAASTYILSSRSEGSDLFSEAIAAGSVSCVATALGALAIACALPSLVPLLYGSGFDQVVRFGPLMLTGAVAFAISKGVAAYLAKLRRASLITQLELVITMVFVASTVPAIKSWGLAGAIYSFQAATWIGALLYLSCFVRVWLYSRRSSPPAPSPPSP